MYMIMTQTISGFRFVLVHCSSIFCNLALL